MEMEYSNGLMAPNIMDNGKIIRCMAQVNSNGLMAECTEENMLMIRSMVKAFTHGLMGVCTKVTSRMVNSTEKAYIGKTTDKRSMAYGKKERKSKSLTASKSLWKLMKTLN